MTFKDYLLLQTEVAGVGAGILLCMTVHAWICYLKSTRAIDKNYWGDRLYKNCVVFAIMFLMFAFDFRIYRNVREPEVAPPEVATTEAVEETTTEATAKRPESSDSGHTQGRLAELITTDLATSDSEDTPSTVDLFRDEFYDETLDANVVVENDGAGATYTLTRKNEYGISRKVQIFSCVPNFRFYGETGYYTKYIKFEFAPQSYRETGWYILNSYGFGSKYANGFMSEGEIVYVRNVTGARAPLKLNESDFGLVDKALDGLAQWDMTELSMYAAEDEVFDLTAWLDHYDYEYRGLVSDVPRYGIREDDIASGWMTFVRPDGATVRLMAWDTREGPCLAWAMCDSADYWDVEFVPMAIPSDFHNTVVVNGERYQTTDEILGILLQYTAARHLHDPLVYERAVVERNWHDQPGWASYEAYADAVLPKG